MAVGYVYIFSNSAYPGLLKIGYTTHTVESRAAELSASTGVLAPFVVEYWHLSAEADDVERLVHEHFKAQRESPKREFFRVDLDTAIDEIEKHLKTPPTKFRRLPPARASDGLRTCNRCGHRWVKDFVNMFCPKCGF